MSGVSFLREMGAAVLCRSSRVRTGVMGRTPVENHYYKKLEAYQIRLRPTVSHIIPPLTHAGNS
jgi:hypothetical protein